MYVVASVCHECKLPCVFVRRRVSVVHAFVRASVCARMRAYVLCLVCVCAWLVELTGCLQREGKEETPL